MHVIRGSRGCRIAPAPPWQSSSHLKRCSSRPSRYAWSLRRRCGPEPGWRERPGAGVGGGREAWDQREGRGGRAAWPCCPPPAARPPRIPPDRPCPAPAARAPFPVWTQGESPGPLRCQLPAPRPSLQAARVAQFGISGQEVPTGDDNVDDNKWS